MKVFQLHIFIVYTNIYVNNFNFQNSYDLLTIKDLSRHVRKREIIVYRQSRLYLVESNSKNVFVNQEKNVKSSSAFPYLHEISKNYRYCIETNIQFESGSLPITLLKKKYVFDLCLKRRKL